MYQYFIGSALISNIVMHLSNMLITNCSVLSIFPVFYHYYANELVASKDGISA